MPNRTDCSLHCQKRQYLNLEGKSLPKPPTNGGGTDILTTTGALRNDEGISQYKEYMAERKTVHNERLSLVCASTGQRNGSAMSELRWKEDTTLDRKESPRPQDNHALGEDRMRLYRDLWIEKTNDFQVKTVMSCTFRSKLSAIIDPVRWIF